MRPLFGTKSAIVEALDRFFGPAGSLDKVMQEIRVQEAAGGQRGGVAAGPLQAKPGGRAPAPAGPGQRAGASAEQVTGLIAAAENAPVVRMVDSIIKQAVDNRASDIHIEPEQEATYLRYRIDGILYDVPPPPKHLEPAVISRIKIMAGMDIAERRLPQDGRIQVNCDGKEVDLRVASFPTICGENLSLRVLDKSAIQLDLEQLGFAKRMLKQFLQMLDRPHGILLVTGPTGSGKTTTLYGALKTLDAVKKNIITLEDPVEYRLPRIRQAQIDVKAGLTFANGLRAILRQDPNIILIGEIRDLETAEIAVHAALTGHLVLATLHTNDAPGALTRLIDMGVEPFLAASSVIGVLAQRLVRTLCPKCKEGYPATPEILKGLGVEERRKVTLYRLKGCDACKQTGYRGRTALYELMATHEAIRALVLKKASSAQMKEAAVARGMETLHQAGAEKAMEGMTTVEEVLRVTEHEIDE